MLDVKENHVLLYKYMFPPDLQHPTLAVIGCIQPNGSLWPTAELQSRLATRVFKVKLICLTMSFQKGFSYFLLIAQSIAKVITYLGETQMVRIQLKI